MLNLRGRKYSFFREENGAILVTFALVLPLLLLLIALVVDLGLARLTANKLQIAADAAALAGASQLPDDGDVRAEAKLYSAKNFDPVIGHPILLDADILTGNWDGAAFTAGGTPKNAVQVTTRRSDANSNPLATTFGRYAGVSNFQLFRTAVAESSDLPSPCKNGGFFSAGNVYSGSNNSYVADFCLFGEDGVKIGSDNSFSGGAVIGMNDLVNFEQSGNNEGTDEALTQMEKPLILPTMIPDVISDMRRPALTNMPGFITKGPVELDEITDSTTLESGTLYIVDEVADLGSDVTVHDVAIVAKKEIKIGSGAEINNVVFATPDKILFGSNNEFGSSGYCSSGSYNTYLFSGSNIEFSSNNTLRGVQMGAGEQLKLGSDISAMMNVYGEANGSIDYGSADNMGACENGLESQFGVIEMSAGPMDFALVR